MSSVIGAMHAQNQCMVSIHNIHILAIINKDEKLAKSWELSLYLQLAISK